MATEFDSISQRISTLETRVAVLEQGHGSIKEDIAEVKVDVRKIDEKMETVTKLTVQVQSIQDDMKQFMEMNKSNQTWMRWLIGVLIFAILGFAGLKVKDIATAASSMPVPPGAAQMLNPSAQ